MIEKRNEQTQSAFWNNFEYLAFWAVNDFVRENAKLFNLSHVEGYSMSRFFYWLRCEIFYNLDEPPVSSVYSSALDEFSKCIEHTKGSILQNTLLNTEDFSLQHYVVLNLKRMNYQAAVIGMYQLFEIEWKSYGGEKFDYVEKNTSDTNVKKNIAELINARNWIVHHRTLKTENSANNKLKTDDWGAQKLNQFQIFYRQKPWEWYRYLEVFLQK